MERKGSNNLAKSGAITVDQPNPGQPPRRMRTLSSSSTLSSNPWVFYLGTGNQSSRFGENPRVKKSSLTTILTEKIFSLLWIPTLLLCFLAGCPASSEWDRQWLEVQTLLQEGRLQEAKKLLQDILPSIRHNGPADTQYAQVIYQLGNIARLEGDTGQAGLPGARFELRAIVGPIPKRLGIQQ